MMTRLKKIDGVYNVQVRAGGKNKFISTGKSNKVEAAKVVEQSGVEQLSTAASASRLTQKAIGQILTGKNLTCTKALEEYQKYNANFRSGSSQATSGYVIEAWLKECKLESVPPSAIKAEHISKWINNPKSDWVLSTRRQALSRIRGFFRFCANNGWIVSDVSRLVELDYNVLSHEQKEGGQKEPFTDEEVKFLISSLRKDWKLAEKDKHELFRDKYTVLFFLVAVSIAKETGFRISDVAQLEWRSFGDKVGYLVVWTDKTNKRVEHPISETVQNLIPEIPVMDVKYLFPDQAASIKNIKRRAELSVQFGRLCERLELKNKSFHLLRSYKATSAYSKLDKEALARKLAENLSLDQIAALLGHSNRNTTKGYIK